MLILVLTLMLGLASRGEEKRGMRGGELGEERD